MVGLVDDVSVERPDVNLCRSDRVVTQRLTDDRDAHSILPKSNGFLREGWV